MNQRFAMNHTTHPRRPTRNRPRFEGLEARSLLSLAGAIDPSFGTSGQISIRVLPTNLPSISIVSGNRLSAVEANGTIVLVSDYYEVDNSTYYDTIEELNADGSADTSFGQGGQASFAVGNFFLTEPVSSANASESLVVQPDGTIDVAGLLGNQGSATTPSFGVVQITPTGTLDTSFGNQGIATLPTLDADQEAFQAIGSMTLTSSGQLVVAGSALTSTTSASEFFAAEFNTNGTLDTSFGTSGVTLVPVTINNFTIDNDTGVAVESSGEVILAGYAANDETGGSLAHTFNESVVIGLTASGTLDTSFGATSAGGEVIIPPVPSSPSTLGIREVLALALQSNDQIVLAETISLAGQDQSLSTPVGDLTRLNSDGTIDTSFGVDGTATFTNSLIPGGLSIEGNGQILVPGTDEPIVNNEGEIAYALGRFNSDGTPDATFGKPETPGLATYLIESGDGIGLSTASINPEGQIILGGYLNHFVGISGTSTDSYEVIGAYSTSTITPVETKPSDDFDGSGQSDIAVYLTASGEFAYRPSNGGPDVIEPFGIPGVGQTIPAPGDYDGSGQTELAAYLPSQGIYAYRPADGGPDVLESFGIAGPGQSIPAPGDYFGTGVDDIAVYMPSLGAFGIRNPAGGPDEIISFGTPGIGQSIPVTGDYFGTDQSDIAVYLTSIGAYAIRNPTTGVDEIIPFGIPGAGNSIPIPGDYDGSGKTELAVYLPSLGEFIYRPANGGPDVVVPFGTAGDGSIPDPGDYGGFGYDQIGIYDPNYASFAYRESEGGPDVIVSFGSPGIGASLPLDAPISSNVVIAAGSITPGSSASSTVSSESVTLTKATATPGGPAAKAATKAMVRIASTLPAQADSSKPKS
jgi:uncharacterized delta-60 repeat protein